MRRAMQRKQRPVHDNLALVIERLRQMFIAQGGQSLWKPIECDGAQDSLHAYLGYGGG
jgi:hypothetical protein